MICIDASCIENATAVLLTDIREEKDHCQWIPVCSLHERYMMESHLVRLVGTGRIRAIFVHGKLDLLR